MKVLVISQPKSGTYLCANLLQELGLFFTELHISESHYQKYNLKNLEDCKKNPKKYTTKISIDKSINLIADNQFAVSHLYYSSTTSDIIYNFKKVILTRDYDEVVDSWNRFATETNRPKDSYRIKEENQKNIFNWLQEPNTIHLTFSDMYNKNINAIDTLQEFLFDKVITNSSNALLHSLSKPSLTKSSLR